MDDAFGLLAGIIIVILVVTVIVYIAVILAVIAAVASPAFALGVILRRALTRRYELSAAKKRQMALLMVLTLSLPFLAFSIHDDLRDDATALAITAYAGIIFSLATSSTFLALTAYRQHFARPRQAIRQTRSSLKKARHNFRRANYRTRGYNCFVQRIERRCGLFLQTQGDLSRMSVDLMESSADPALLGRLAEQWEREAVKRNKKDLAKKIQTIETEIQDIPVWHFDDRTISLRLQSLVFQRFLVAHEIKEYWGTNYLSTAKTKRDRLLQEKDAFHYLVNMYKNQLKENYNVIGGLKNSRLALT